VACVIIHVIGSYRFVTRFNYCISGIVYLDEYHQVRQLFPPVLVFCHTQLHCTNYSISEEWSCWSCKI